MKKVLITFSGAPYYETTKQIVENAKLCGVDDVQVYDDLWMTHQDFYHENEWLWQHPHKRGFGWYAWKPYIILHALSRVSESDVVLYVDADTVPISPLDPLFTRCQTDGGIMLFASEGHRQYEYCKRDCYVVMGQDMTRYYDVPAGVARFMLFQRGSWKALQFLIEWMAYCVNPFANTFDKSVLGEELPGFIEHRAEQAIMTNLAHKYKLHLYREACEAGNTTTRDRKLYGQLFRQNNPYEHKLSFDPIGSVYRNVPL